MNSWLLLGKNQSLTVFLRTDGQRQQQPKDIHFVRHKRNYSHLNDERYFAAFTFTHSISYYNLIKFHSFSGYKKNIFCTKKNTFGKLTFINPHKFNE